VETFHAIRPRFQFQIDVRIRDLITCRPVADYEEDRVFLREIQEMMAVARSGWKADAGALPNGCRVYSTRGRSPITRDCLLKAAKLLAWNEANLLQRGKVLVRPSRFV